MSNAFAPNLRLVIIAATGLCALTGCANLGDGMASQAFVDPARYELFDCKRLEDERAKLDKRTLELQALIDKAGTGAGGAFVGEVAYRNDYISARAQRRLAEQAWTGNRCATSLSPPPPPASPRT